jgi:hypothetical protein
MATINLAKILSGQLGSHQTGVARWNNPPTGTVLSFFENAYPIPSSVPDHFTGTGSVRIGQVTFTGSVVPPPGQGENYVSIEVINPDNWPITYDRI